MSESRDFDRIAAAWLAGGPRELADRVLDAALDEVHVTHQRRRPLPWKTPPMSTPMRLAAGIGAIAVAGLAGMTLLRPNPGTIASPSQSIAPSPSIAPSSSIAPSRSIAASRAPTPRPPVVSLDTLDWMAFTSERYGFDLMRPPAFAEKPSTRTWQLSDPGAGVSGTTETFTYAPGPDGAVNISAWSAPVTPATSLDDWIQAWCATGADYCPVPPDPSRYEAVTTANGVAGVSFAGKGPEDRNAAVLVGNRIYVVALWHEGTPVALELGGSGSLLEAVVSTVSLRPNGAVPDRSPPALTGTFTSPRYGYSVRFPDSVWSANPATETWVPGVMEQSAFDYLGSGRGFRAVSAVIPAGFVEDPWIAHNATMADIAACAPVRSTLSDIVIDGRVGKVRMSCTELEATVVVDGRFYMFTLFLDDGEPFDTAGGRALFEAMIATVQLTPETAEDAPTTKP